MKNKIIIPGGSGFLGTYVAKYFAQKGYEVTVLTRREKENSGGIKYLLWDGKSLGDWSKSFEHAKLILNLAGKSVDCRYNKRNKQSTLDSRINSTKIIGLAIANCTDPPEIWMNAASATIYRHTINEPANEEINGVIGNGFSVDICKAWEATFDAMDTSKTRKLKLRTAITLGKGGGAFPKIFGMTKLGLGGNQGIGNQYISWLHVLDFARIIEWLIEKQNINGVINCAAPNPVSNKDFMKMLRAILNIPFGLPTPSWLLEIGAFFMRTETELILKSRKVVPGRLLEQGFKFKFPNLENSLEDLLRV